ncbi:hypothetical protein LWI29_033624 [Acer saccharum]|uniref:Disease resistance protein n=1 Tax=Acer saccharum TaxID=4024 RepID=A0AA39VZP8_ACESA|nr:hypothetical protein LWI29_033624 [Acer saccharum]
MNPVSPVVGFLNRVWDCTVKCSDPIRHLRENLQSLEEAKRELEAISRDVESNVSQLEEQQHSRRTNEVQNWLETVDRTLKEVEDTLQRGDQEIKKRILRFEDMLDFQNIPAGVISCLSSLQMFCWFSYSSVEAYHVDISLLQELEGLEHIKDISLMLSSVDCIDKLFSSPKLKACVTSLRIRCPEECSSLVIDISSSTMKRMKILQIIGCKSLKELRFCGMEDNQEMPNNLPSLEFLYLRKCPIKDLTWFIHVPSLLWLTIGECPSLTEVIACDIGFSEIQEAFDIFPNLGRMVLINLPSLKSICRPAMPFPSLKSMWIWDCPNLRNLPFNLETVKTSYLNEISASEEWWHRLEWGNEATKHHFTSKFKQATVLGLGL